MAKIYTLKDREGATLYPVTSSKAVINGNGEDLDAMLASERRQQAKALRGYATSEALAGGLAGKQDALTPSSDLQITDNIIGLTDMAKKRLFIDMWNEACGKYGRYNEQTGFFELNGLVDISYEEALSIIKHSEFNTLPVSAQNHFARVGSVRTLMPIRMSGTYNLRSAFHACSGLEVLNFLEVHVNSCTFSSLSETFKFCQNLKRIIGSPLIASNERNLVSAFEQCYKLEEVYLWLSRTSVSFKDCKNLQKDSLIYMVEHGDNSTVTVHPDVYSKITDPDNAEWHPLLAQAEAKSISFATI